jgi:hypothetical protein
MTDELLKAQMILLYPEDYSKEDYIYAQKVLAHHHEAQDFVNELQEVRTYIDQSYQDFIQPSSHAPSMQLHISHSDTNILSTKSRSAIMQVARQQIVYQKNTQSQASIELSDPRSAWWKIFLTPQFTALTVLSVLVLFVWQPSLITLDSGFSISEEVKKIDKSPVAVIQLEPTMNKELEESKEVALSPAPVPSKDLLRNEPIVTPSDSIVDNNLGTNTSDILTKLSLGEDNPIPIQKPKVSRKSKKKKRSKSGRKSKSLKSYSPKRNKANKKRKRKIAKKKRKNRKSSYSDKNSTKPKEYRFDRVGGVGEAEGRADRENRGNKRRSKPSKSSAVSKDRDLSKDDAHTASSSPSATTKHAPSSTTNTDDVLDYKKEERYAKEEAPNTSSAKRSSNRRTTNKRSVLPWQLAQEAYQQSAIQDALRYLLSWIERNPTHPRYQEALRLGIQWATQHKQNRYVDLFKRLKAPGSQNKKAIKNSRSRQSVDQFNMEDSNSESQKTMDPISF